MSIDAYVLLARLRSLGGQSARLLTLAGVCRRL